MLPLLAREFAALCGSQLVGDPTLTIQGFATDSREVKPGDLFIAISGERVDGHEFVKNAMSMGASLALVERAVEAPHILVDSIVEALATFGRNVRSNFSNPVIGITGSAGKTTCKEFVSAALATQAPVLRTPGNRNTEYTSPLIWADVTPETGFVVVEMAMRGFDQITHLASIAQPGIGIVTNIGYSHMLQLGNRDGIATAKGELLEALPENGTAIIWREDEYFKTLQARAGSKTCYTFGTSEDADCRITGYRALSWSESEMEGTCFGKPWKATAPAIGRHIALDAAAAVLCAAVCGLDPQEAADGLKNAQLPPMRMEVRSVNGATVLLDTYNASPPSMLAAIETVCEMPVTGRRLAVLGQMLELGDLTEAAHRSIGEAVEGSSLDHVTFIGESMKSAIGKVKDPTRAAFATSDSELKSVVRDLKEGDILLVKGSRALQLERIFEA